MHNTFAKLCQLSQVVDHKQFVTRAAFDERVDAALRGASVEWVCLAGFMWILGAEFVRSWAGRLLNIHPSLLPSFRGAHAHRDAIAAGVSVTGATVHFVAVRFFIISSGYTSINTE